MKIAVNTAKLLRNVPLPDEIATVHDSAAIVDMGTSQTRVGFSGDDAPRLTAPTVVGASKDGSVSCFQKAYKEREESPITRVMDRGLITNWDAFEHSMLHLYDLLGMGSDNTNCPLLITENALVPKEQREQLVEVLFEKVGVKNLYVSLSPVLALYASGRTSGLVVEMGHGTCHTVPVFEGFALFHSVLQLDFGGGDLTTEMGNLLTKSGYQFPTAHNIEIAQFLKELYCPILTDRTALISATSENNRSDVATHVLPDGKEVVVGTERYNISEGLFDPSTVGRNGLRGIHSLCHDSVRKCDPDISSLLYSNVILAGGTSLHNGLPDRFSRELQDIAPLSEKVRVYAATERRNAAWVGGSILASLPTFQDMWVGVKDYGETGKCTGHRNCL